MGFRLKRRRRLDRELGRLVGKQLDEAVDALQDAAPDEEAIHRARTRLKKLRAILRLLHDALGPAYDAHNVALRDAAHRLSTLRDADALRETFKALRRRYPVVIAPEAARHIEAELDARARQHRHESAHLPRQARHVLVTHRDEVIAAVANAASRDAVRDGLTRSYRRARKTLPQAGLDARAADFHLWRRRVKDVWYQVQLFDRVASDTRRLSGRLKELEQVLGDDHNLSCLRDVITAEPDRYGPAASVAAVLRCIAARQRALRNRALRMGPRSFARPPKRFRRRAQRWLGALKPRRSP